MVDYVKQGKANRRKGAAFETKVRKLLESKGWIVDKWTNNIKSEVGLTPVKENSKLPNVIIKGKCVQARSNRFNMRSTGFPDFMIYKPNIKVRFVECKVAKYLDKEEKAKAQWYLANDYCKCFYVAFLNKEKEIEFKSIELTS